MERTGLTHIYTGDGKGKTTAAVGLTVRALSNGYNVLYCSFHKRPKKYGYSEMEALKKLGATVLNFETGHPHLDDDLVGGFAIQNITQSISMISECMHAIKIDLLVMDEILISVRDNHLPKTTLIDFIKNKPSHIELVLTGCDATSDIIELADYVSEIKKIKHPYDQEIASRKGIDF
jgi:cob(I)alamin adenosyltransferase